MAEQELGHIQLDNFMRRVSGKERPEAIPYSQVMSRVAGELRRYGGSRLGFGERDREGVEEIIDVAYEVGGPDTSSIWSELCAHLSKGESDIVELAQLAKRAEQIQLEHRSSRFRAAAERLSPSGQSILQEAVDRIAREQELVELDWVGFARQAPARARAYLENLCAKLGKGPEVLVRVSRP